ncbi:unnamed protein product, partial [Symbiodinium sp. CCMP2456]
WVRDNKQRWQEWLPIETNCITGFGLADAAGNFLMDRANATSCEVCTPGRYSQEYLDTGGQTGCISCDEVRTTRLLAASRREDCVCKPGLIEASPGVCVSCGEGLYCPVGSTARPEVLPMYFSSMEVPLETYRCQSHCPGGAPGSCDGGRVGRTCSECPDNFYSSGNQCVECGVALPVLWLLGVGIVVCSIFSSYYLLTSSYTAKASVLTCTTCSFGMMVSLFQNLGVIQTVSVSFTTMTNIGLVPFMCYRHPAGSESVLKYSDVFCNSAEHTLMQLLGMAVLALSGAFLASCFFFAWKAPSWSGKAIQGGVRFLIFRFRPNVWWFGLVLLTRGPLLSMPAVAAPNKPAVQFVCLLGILLLSLQLQVWYLPWKAPILNLVDGVTNLLLVMLLAIGLGRLGPDPEDGPAVLDSLAAAISAMMMSVLGLMLVLAMAALFYKKALGSNDELWIMNLGKPPSSKDFCDTLSNFLHSQQDMQEKEVRQVVDALCVYDYCDVNASIVLLSTELGFRSKLTDALARRRITSSGSFASLPAGSKTQQMDAEVESVDEEDNCLESNADEAAVAKMEPHAEDNIQVTQPTEFELRLDVLEESGHLPQRLADRLLSCLGRTLKAAKCTGALPLQELSLRLASFADNAEPLRPSSEARIALIEGLECLPLRRLQLSFLPLRQKDVLEKVEDASSGRCLTFTSMLRGLGHLEHLVLTHNGMFGDVAMELAKALQQLHLRTADFSRNRISVEAWKQMADALG